ncbi:serine/threonine-protein kinase [Pelagicoccus sp. SDUM812005]|uniref:serine/threonine protein kinase n=1 Tax=Pelagicoccus sp. SDUM812005 TaxID=3041257 RepID=UPI0028106120|nr:serine/threonine-protein kinase [Pelagicoccus sp. SDUM812005]MDQ8180750.1 serine/threonine-protein kinase [Pelagicoccus sp. SDUM812005]
MNSESAREEEVFDAARAIADPALRSAFLETECADDPGMLRRLKSMLETTDEVDDFFAESARAINSEEVAEKLRRDPDEEEEVGVKIGRYRLLQRLGDGGCGVVYLAEQEEPVRRAVALKIIRLGMETERVISRFEAERQALAMMDHPNIARVFDAGETAGGSPYFVMEHVRGEALTDYCRGHKLGIVDRLKLFMQVCHAIQHAHQKGIIHGDIKPSNIIVSEHDGGAVPRVIDFGIARATEAGFSEMMLFSGPDKQVLGTPSYMSPEQVQLGGLDVDTRSDVYSLGVLLYELLTDKPSFDKDRLANVGIADLRRIVGKEEPPLPSERILSLGSEEADTISASLNKTPKSLVSRLKGDLDCIVMKAMSKDRHRRYETADALATEIKRYLADEPVVAHSPGFFYRYRKMVKRNRTMVLASTAVALTLIFGLGLSTWLLMREREARQRAEAAEQQQARLRQEAEFRGQLTEAAMLVSKEEYAEADVLVGGVELNEATMEGAAVFRALGEWHAINGRWRLAAERFKTLLKVNQLEGADVSSLDYLELGPVLIELGDLDEYDRFRRQAVERFSGVDLPFADRIVKISLLVSANGEMLRQLEPFAEASKVSIHGAETSGDNFQAAWRSMSHALFEYRRANYAEAVAYARRCFAYGAPNAPRDAAAGFVLAMASYQMGRTDDAEAAYRAAARLVESKYVTNIDLGNPVQGFWFDWAFARVIKREASRLLGME